MSEICPNCGEPADHFYSTEPNIHGISVSHCGCFDYGSKQARDLYWNPDPKDSESTPIPLDTQEEATL